MTIASRRVAGGNEEIPGLSWFPLSRQVCSLFFALWLFVVGDSMVFHIGPKKDLAERVAAPVPPGTRGTCASMHVGITPYFLRSAFLLRLKARGIPSLGRPLAGAKTHWVFAHLRLTNVLHPSGRPSAVQICSKLGHPCLAKTSSPVHPCVRRSAGHWSTGPIAVPRHPGDFVEPWVLIPPHNKRSS